MKKSEALDLPPELKAAVTGWLKLKTTCDLMMSEPFNNKKRSSDSARGRILRGFMEGHLMADKASRKEIDEMGTRQRKALEEVRIKHKNDLAAHDKHYQNEIDDLRLRLQVSYEQVAKLHSEQKVCADDLAAMLRAAGLSDAARPYSAHETVQRELLPNIAALRAKP